MENQKFYATGRRKVAVARVWLKPGTGLFSINGCPLENYFSRESLCAHVKQPLLHVDSLGQFDVIATVKGGGHSGQAGALRLGISRALVTQSEGAMRPALKHEGFLTRDARMVERVAAW